MVGLTGLAARRIMHAAAMIAASLVLVLTANGPAAAETRTLHLYHVHLRETSSVTYKRNGRFLQEGLRQANWALRDWRESKPTNMDPQVLDMLWEIQRRTRAPGPIHIIGGYRSPATNRTLRSRSSGVADNSQHTRGKAIDFFIPGVPLSRVRDAAMQLQIGGVGYYPRSGSPFVHIDTGNGRYWPRMNRNELARIFPQGNTIYVPADGRPLPGYDGALASYNQRRSGASVQMADARTGGRGLLARLFGGGADEAEDNAASEATPVPTRPSAPVRQAPTAPQAPVQVAAAPAPRPASSLPAGVAMPDRDGFDTSGRSPVPRAGIPEQAQVAAVTRVPIPTFAPARLVPSAPAEAPAAPAEEVLVAAAEPVAPSPAAPGQLAYAIPTPSQRPPFEAVLQAGSVPLPVRSPEGEAVAVAALTQEIEEPGSVTEVLVAAIEPEQLATSVDPERLVTPVANPRTVEPAIVEPAVIPSTLVAALEAEAAAIEVEGLPDVSSVPQPIDALSTGTGKGGRVRGAGPAVVAGQPAAAPEAIASRVAIASLVTSPDVRAAEGRSTPPNAGMLVVDVPVTVLASGFAPKGQAASSNAFSGTAVNFLPVRRLQ